jgi:predicted transcriptional regulator
MVKARKIRALTIRFTEDDAATLEQLSEREDVSAATIVRKALREYAARILSDEPTRGKARK